MKYLTDEPLPPACESWRRTMYTHHALPIGLYVNGADMEAYEDWITRNDPRGNMCGPHMGPLFKGLELIAHPDVRHRECVPFWTVPNHLPVRA